MVNRSSISAVLAALLLLLLSAAGCRRTQQGLNPGDVAPDFSAPSFEGSLTSLSAERGKLVLLHVWATWCEPCLEDLPALQRLYSELSPRGFVVLGVAVRDNRRSVSELKSKLGLSFPILMDSEGAAARRYESSAFPESFLISPEGKIIMIQDPETGSPVARMIGPKRWDSPAFRAVLEGYLPGARLSSSGTASPNTGGRH